MGLPLALEAFDWRLGFGAYLLGLVRLALILLAGGWLGLVLRRRLLPGWEGPPAWLASGVLGLAALLLGAELLGLFGLFKPWFYLALLALLALVSLHGATAGTGQAEPLVDHANPSRSSPHSGHDLDGFTPERPGGWVVTVLAGLAAAVVLLRFGWDTAAAYGTGMTGFDTQWYHGPFTALFLQSGDTFALNNSIAPQYLSWFYPQNAELLHAIAVMPFARDLLSPGLNLVLMAATMMAAWCVGRPVGLAPHSLLAACLVLGTGMLADQAGEMRNDLPAVFFTLAATATAVNAWVAAARRRTPVAAGALLAIGMAAGLAAGTKLNYLAPAGATVVALALALPAGRRLRGFGLLFGGAFLTGGYWYLRNLVATGNPLPWITSAGPLSLPGPSQEIGGREPHGVIEYLFDGSVWADWFLPGLRESLSLLWPLIAAAAIASTLLLLAGSGRRRAPIPTGLARALAAVILATVAAWLAAPASAEGPAGEPVGFVSGLRYLAPALVMALALLPVVSASWLGRAGRLGAPFAVSDRGAESEPAASRPVYRDSNERSGPAPARRRPGAPLALALLVVLAAIGWPLQRHYLEHRYAEPDFATPGLNRIFSQAGAAGPEAPEPGPVATTATRLYPLIAPDLETPVRFVGVAEAEGGFRRPIGCREWRRAVNAIAPRELIVAWDRIERGRPPLPPAAAWAAADPATERLTSGGGAATFRVTGALDPSTCPG